MKTILLAVAGLVMGAVGAINTVVSTIWPSQCRSCRHHRRRQLKDGTPIHFCAKARHPTESCPAFSPRVDPGGSAPSAESCPAFSPRVDPGGSAPSADETP